MYVKPILRAASGQQSFVSHFADPRRARNPDYSCVWLLVTGVTAIAAAKVEPAGSVAAFAIVTDATAEGCAIIVHLGFGNAAGVVPCVNVKKIHCFPLK